MQKHFLERRLSTEVKSLMQEFWVDNARGVIDPKAFKNEIGKLNQKFSNYDQQDSQELVSYLLDGLHEELNLSNNKEYTEVSEKTADESFLEASLRFWDSYKIRNNSIIVNLFHGQFKSTTSCTKCMYQSVTFDPFTFMSLPIPTLCNIQIYFIPRSNALKPRKLSINIPVKALFCDLPHFISKAINKQVEGQSLLVKKDNKPYKLCEPLDNVKDELRKNCAFLFFYEVQNFEQSEAAYYYTIAIEIQNATLESISFPRLLRVHKTEVILYILHFAFFKLRNYFTICIQDQLALLKDGLRVDSNEENSEVEFDKFYDSLMNANSQLHELAKDFFMKIPIKLSSFSIIDSPELIIDEIERIISIGELPTFQLNLNLENFSDVSLIKQLNAAQIIRKKGNQHSNNISLYDCLNNFVLTEKLDEDNEWTCDHCNSKVQATVKLEPFYLPNNLIIQLKRFEYGFEHTISKKNRGRHSSKVETEVNFPINQILDLSDYVSQEMIHASKYELYAISHHDGTCSGGHYTASAKCLGNWHYFNDSSTISRNPECDSSAYLLFYKRIE